MTGRASRLERYFAALVKRYGSDLDPYVREFRFHQSRRWRFDFAWPDRLVAVEIDGGQWVARGGRHARDADRWKMNAAQMDGWTVLRFSGEMLRAEPERCINQLRVALAGASPRSLF